MWAFAASVALKKPIESEEKAVDYLILVAHMMGNFKKQTLSWYSVVAVAEGCV